MEIVEVDVIDPKPRQRLVEGFMDILWVGPHDPVRSTATETKLCGRKISLRFPVSLIPVSLK